MINRVKICAAAITMAGCGVQSSVVDNAVMSATLDCTSHEKQQRALQVLRLKLATGKPLAQRCDAADCSMGVADGSALGGKTSVMMAPDGWLGIGWFNKEKPPSERQKALFKEGVASVPYCRVDTRDGW